MARFSSSPASETGTVLIQVIGNTCPLGMVMPKMLPFFQNYTSQSCSAKPVHQARGMLSQKSFRRRNIDELHGLEAGSSHAQAPAAGSFDFPAVFARPGLKLPTAACLHHTCQ